MWARSGISATPINVVTLSAGEGRGEISQAENTKAGLRLLTRNLDPLVVW